MPAWFFVLVVVRKEDRFLLVHETKHGERWYLPAGRVEPGEDLVVAAYREVLEETGVPVSIEGILRIEHLAGVGGWARVRIIFAGKPKDDIPPKTEPDEHSLEARWITLSELEALPLRNDEVSRILDHVAAGGTIHPLSLLAPEGAPFD